MEWKKTSAETITETKVCTGETVVKVLTCTWAPPVELTTDLKVEMDAQIFYATDGSSLIKKQVRSKIWSGCDENMRRSPKNSQKLTDDQPPMRKKIQEKSPEFLK